MTVSPRWTVDPDTGGVSFYSDDEGHVAWVVADTHKDALRGEQALVGVVRDAEALPATKAENERLERAVILGRQQLDRVEARVERARAQVRNLKAAAKTAEAENETLRTSIRTVGAELNEWAVALSEHMQVDPADTRQHRLARTLLDSLEKTEEVANDA